MLQRHSVTEDCRTFSKLTANPHLAEPLASAGFVAVLVGHRVSPSFPQHRLDRPADVSFLLDQFASGAITLPADFAGTLDTSVAGHTGHSAGAYTSMALAGGRYPYGQFRDPRIAAIAPISPQGAGAEFEAFDLGGDDHRWSAIDIPVALFIGGDELDINGLGTFIATNWRRQPFKRLSSGSDRFQAVIEAQDHLDMGGAPTSGDPEVRAYIGQAITEFFTVYLGEHGSPCAIGVAGQPRGLAVETARKASPQGALKGC